MGANMCVEVEVVPAVDPRNPKYRWVVSSKGADGAFVRIQCLDMSDPVKFLLGRKLAEILIPREVADMVAMAVLYDQMKAQGIEA
jgi:hypothetical protein